MLVSLSNLNSLQPNLQVANQPAYSITEVIGDIGIGTISTIPVSVTSLTGGTIAGFIGLIAHYLEPSLQTQEMKKAMAEYNASQIYVAMLAVLGGAGTGAYFSDRVDSWDPSNKAIFHAARIGASTALITSAAGLSLPAIVASTIFAATFGSKILPNNLVSGAILGATLNVTFFSSPFIAHTTMLGGAALGATVATAKRFFNW